MAEHALRIDVADALGGIGSYGPVMLHVSRQTPPLERLKQVQRIQRRLIDTAGEVTGSLSIVEPTAVAPQSKEERDAQTEMMLRSPVRAAAIIIEGSGFRAAAARTVIAGFFLLKKPYPYKVVSRAAEGALWLVETLGKEGATGLDAAALAAALAQLQAAIPG